MWWVNKFGSVSGPYTDEQVVRLVQTNRLTRLCKISSDRVSWKRLGESEFWAGSSGGSDEMELPSVVTEDRRAERCTPRTNAPIEQDPTDLPDVSEAAAGSREYANPPPRRSTGFRNDGKRSSRKTYIAAGVCIAFVLSCVAGVVLFTLAPGRGGRKVDAAEALHAGSETATPNASQDEKSDGKTQGAEITFESVKLKVALIKTDGGSGTGFFMKFGGKTYLVSNEHVIRSARTPIVTLVDGTEVRLGALDIAEDRDLARYEVEGTYSCFEQAEGVPNNGDKVWVYGNSVGDGVITTLTGSITGVGGMALKIDADIVGGNSGSPIVDSKGLVIGVASYIKSGDGGKDWTTRDTEFDKVRRFGTRFAGVRWLSVSRTKFEKECGNMSTFKIYWQLLYPYLVCLDVSPEQLENMKLEQKDIDRRLFGDDDQGFHEMLMALSKALAGQAKSWNGWQSLCVRREALLKELNNAVKTAELTYDTAVKTLDDFDRGNDVDKKWEKVKTRHLDFLAKRKEALLMARSFLTGREWQDPRMRHGVEDDNFGSVEWYLEGIQYFLDQNTQKLKDTHAALKQIEKGDDDED